MTCIAATWMRGLIDDPFWQKLDAQRRKRAEGLNKNLEDIARTFQPGALLKRQAN